RGNMAQSVNTTSDTTMPLNIPTALSLFLSLSLSLPLSLSPSLSPSLSLYSFKRDFIGMGITQHSVSKDNTEMGKFSLSLSLSLSLVVCVQEWISRCRIWLETVGTDTC